MSDDPEWFAQKRFGYGSGMPISWQGWLVLAVYLGIVIGASLLLPHKPWALVGILIPATATFIVITAKTTRGGWRWRWPKD